MKREEILKKAKEMYQDAITFEGKTYHMVDKEGGTDIDEETVRAQVICEEDFDEEEGFPIYTMEWKRDMAAYNAAAEEYQENEVPDWETGLDWHNPSDVWEDEGFFC